MSRHTYRYEKKKHPINKLYHWVIEAIDEEGNRHQVFKCKTEAQADRVIEKLKNPEEPPRHD